MKTLYLIHTDDANYTFLQLNVVEKLDNFGDLIKDGMKGSELYTLPIKELNTKLPALVKNCDTTVNFSFSKGKLQFNSPLTKKLLTTKALTAVAICLNLQGERIGLVCCSPTGALYKCDINSIIATMKKCDILTNMFVKSKNGKDEIVLTKGNYIKDKSLVPIMYLGKKLPTVKATNTKVDKNVSNLIPPIQDMIKKGYKQYVDAYNLYNPAYPEDTLWFYDQLMDNGEFDIVKNMLTTDNYKVEQLEEIADGLRKGVDVTEYSDPGIPVSEMQKIRIALETTGFFGGVPLPKEIIDLQNQLPKYGDNSAEAKKIIKAKQIIKSHRKGGK